MPARVSMRVQRCVKKTSDCLTRTFAGALGGSEPPRFPVGPAALGYAGETVTGGVRAQG